MIFFRNNQYSVRQKGTGYHLTGDFRKKRLVRQNHPRYNSADNEESVN